jgi:serine---pyruvate transaminase
LLTKKIFTPGPTQVHPDVLKATISHDTYHRSQDFKTFHMSLLEKLRKIFQTKHYINVLTTSGTGAMEAAVINFCAPREKIIFLHQGRFGARWGAMCKVHGLNAVGFDISYGKSIQPEQYKDLNLDGVSAVFLTHTETSTATLTDVKNTAKYIRGNSDALVIVDAVTSVGAIEFRMDEWNIDVAVSASQKGLMTQPGVAIIAYNERAKEKMVNNTMPRFFFDLRKELKSIEEDNLTMWTPAVGLFYGIDKACDIILSDGLENRWKRTKENANYFRNSAIETGFGIFSKSPADSLTAVTLPDGIPTGKLIRALREKYGIQTANGQAELKDKIMRVSHMGDLDLNDFKELNEIIKKEFNEIKS